MTDGRQTDRKPRILCAGNAVQDVAVGLLAVREAEARGLGSTIEL